MKDSANNTNKLEIEQARYSGKMEGFAWGILTLFSQDSIKKPSEYVHSVENLGLAGSRTELELIEYFIDTKLHDKQKVSILSNYLQGNKTSLLAHTIDHILDDGSENIKYFVSEDTVNKLLNLEERTIENITRVLLDSDMNGSEILGDC